MPIADALAQAWLMCLASFGFFWEYAVDVS